MCAECDHPKPKGTAEVLKPKRTKTKKVEKKAVRIMGERPTYYPLVKHPVHGIARDIGPGPTWNDVEYRVILLKGSRTTVRVPFSELKYRVPSEKQKVLADMKADRRSARKSQAAKRKTRKTSEEEV